MRISDWSSDVCSSDLLEHDARLGDDRQDRRIGRRALGAQRRKHDVEDILVVAQDILQRLDERPRPVAFGRADQFIVEAQTVEQFAQHRIDLMRETLLLPEQIDRQSVLKGKHVSVRVNLDGRLHNQKQKKQQKTAVKTQIPTIQ